MRRLLISGRSGENEKDYIYVDNDKFNYISQFEWAYREDNYIYRSSNNKNGRISISNDLFPHPEGTVIDHWNGHVNENYFANLRIATVSENNRNRRFKKDYKGVYDYDTSYKMIFHVPNSDKVINNSFPHTEEGKIECAKCYNDYAVQFFGKFAALNDIPGDDTYRDFINKIPELPRDENGNFIEDLSDVNKILNDLIFDNLTEDLIKKINSYQWFSLRVNENKDLYKESINEKDLDTIVAVLHIDNSRITKEEANFQVVLNGRLYVSLAKLILGIKTQFLDKIRFKDNNIKNYHRDNLLIVRNASSVYPRIINETEDKSRIQLPDGRFIKIDEEDFNRISELVFYLKKGINSVYVEYRHQDNSISTSANDMRPLEYIVLDEKRKVKILFKNKDKLDFRKENLFIDEELFNHPLQDFISKFHNIRLVRKSKTNIRLVAYVSKGHKSIYVNGYAPTKENVILCAIDVNYFIQNNDLLNPLEYISQEDVKYLLKCKEDRKRIAEQNRLEQIKLEKERQNYINSIPHDRIYVDGEEYLVDEDIWEKIFNLHICNRNGGLIFFKDGKNYSLRKFIMNTDKPVVQEDVHDYRRESLQIVKEKITNKDLFPEWQKLIDNYHGVYIFKQANGIPFYKVNYLKDTFSFSKEGLLVFSKPCSKINAIEAAKAVNKFIEENNLQNLIYHLDEYTLSQQEKINAAYKKGLYNLNEITDSDEEFYKQYYFCEKGYGQINIKNVSVLVDEEDYQRVKNYNWHYSNNAILMRRKVNDKIKTIYLARFILNCYDKNFVDIGPEDEKGKKLVVHFKNKIKNSVIDCRKTNISLMTDKEHKKLMSKK